MALIAVNGGGRYAKRGDARWPPTFLDMSDPMLVTLRCISGEGANHGDVQPATTGSGAPVVTTPASGVGVHQDVVLMASAAPFLAPRLHIAPKFLRWKADSRQRPLLAGMVSSK